MNFETKTLIKTNNNSINRIINATTNSNHLPKTYSNSITLTINNTTTNSNNNSKESSRLNEINLKLERHHHYNSKLGRSFSFKLNNN